MVGSFDYNNNDVMEILNNPNLNDEQKKKLFEKYKFDLKETRRKEIITRLNECAKNNPIITQEEYVNFLKKYNDDDLSKPFEVIEGELEDFSREMQEKYNAYLRKKEAEKKEQEIPVEDPVFDEPEVEEEPVNYDDEEDDDLTPDITPNNYSELVDALYSNSDEDTKEIKPTVFEDDEEEVKEMMPEDIPESLDEKGNANAVIISIIAIIVGMVIMYSIIKLK
ncbi:MAG: hypothetical protein IKF36_06290 [Bacilli bacterium]|nr:hypothetical protein [Bacilli bacterium]